MRRPFDFFINIYFSLINEITNEEVGTFQEREREGEKKRDGGGGERKTERIT